MKSIHRLTTIGVLTSVVASGITIAGEFEPRRAVNKSLQQDSQVGQQNTQPPAGLSGDFDFLAEFRGQRGLQDAIRIDNTASGGTYIDDVGAGHMRMAYMDTDGIRGAGQFADPIFSTFCVEFQDVRNQTRGYDLISVTAGPNPIGGNGEDAYDSLDEAELHAVVAAAIRLGWINDDLSPNAESTDVRRAAIQAGIWRVLFDNSSVTSNVAELTAAIAVLETEAANEPDARIAGLRIMSNPDTQDMLFIVEDDSPPEVVCEVELVADGSLCPCDIDLDGAVTDADLALFLQNYAAGDADFNMDGITDFFDFLDFNACYSDQSGNCGQLIGDGDCCEDEDGDSIKPAVIRMQYTGESCGSSSNGQDDDKFECDGDPMMDEEVYILATDKSDPDDDRAKIWFSGTVGLGQLFDISAFNAGRDKLKSRTYVYIYADDSQDELLQSIEFHTSCSQPLFAGDTFGALRLFQCFDEDGNPSGGPSDDDGIETSVVQVFFSATDTTDDPADITLMGMIDIGCDVIDVEDGQIIEVRCFEPYDPNSDDICESGFGKPAALTLTYTGEDCDATSTTQDSGKFSCDGDPMMDPRPYIVVSDDDEPWNGDARIYFADFVDLGDSFEAEAANAGEDKLTSKTFVSVFTDETCDVLLQQIEFHTSCSQPIRIGDQYGSIRIDGATSTDGDFVGDNAPECGAEFINGRLVITTSSAKLVVIATDSDGNQSFCEKIICEPSEQTGDPEDCCADGNKPTALELIYTGEDCSATNTSQDPDKYSCEGDPEFAQEVYIIASDSDEAEHSDRIYFAGWVMLDEAFIISAANADEDRFKSRTFVTIYNNDNCDVLLQQIEFHTSCSQPLFTGDQYGSILIFGCEDQDPPDSGESCCEDGDKPNELDLKYIGMDCDSASNTQDDDKFVCSGDPLLEQEVFIMVSEDEDPDNDDADIYFASFVSLGETFTVDADAIGRDRFHSRTYVYIFTADGTTLLQSVEFHTSCSQPLNIGDTFGGFELIACRSN
jgi:hypothetical protein